VTPSRTSIALLLAILSVAPTSAAELSATNIAGTDGTVSMLNAGTPVVPIVIGNIQGLALTDPAAPGDNIVIGGGNGNPDLRVMDTYFQGSATAGPDLASTTPPASRESSMVLLEATNGGTVGVDTISWSVTTYRSYDGSGTLSPEFSTAEQTQPEFVAGNVYVTVDGEIVAGDKAVFHNSGETVWHVGAFADVDGDGVGSLTLNVECEDFTAVSGGDTNTSQDFNHATVTLIGWEIADGAFVSGRFDVAFDVLTSANTWPGGDAFDVVPEPVAVGLLCAAAPWVLRRRRRGGKAAAVTG